MSFISGIFNTMQNKAQIVGAIQPATSPRKFIAPANHVAKAYKPTKQASMLLRAR